jgi:DsbC/DsbD-like thiol-disulfide interchange protein
MRRLLFVLFIAIPFFGISQVQKPVKWSFSSKKNADNSFEIHMTATVDNGWHIYSQTTPEGGPYPTTIAFLKNPLLIMSGEVKEVGKLEVHDEPLFGVQVKQYSNKVSFLQSIKVKGKVKTSVKGSVEFMVCNNKQCLPPETIEFSVSLQ